MGKWPPFHLFNAGRSRIGLLRITKAHTDHAGLKVHFADPPMNFTVTCRDTNPLDAFPPMRNQPSSSAPPGPSSSASMAPPSTNVTCLLTAMPSPSHPSTHIRLHRGFNLVTLCLVMTASLVGSSLFSSPQWLEGQEISPGIQVISGPFDLHALSSVPSLDDPLFFKTEGHHYPKCRPSRMVPPFEPPPVQAGVLNSPIQPLDIGNAFANDVPAFSTKFYTTVVVKSTKDHTVLPHNANLGSIQPFNSNHEQVFSEAADHTAHTLADTWFEYAKHTGTTQNPSSVARSQAQPTGTSCFPQSWSLQAQTSEMTKAGLDSSYLSPFLPEPDLDPPHVHPLVEDVSLDPHSEEYFQKLVAALDLDTESYAHVDPTIMTRFKDLIRKYAHAVYLPGTSLNTIKGFHHNIHTGDSPPVYRLPYRKSPHELAIPPGKIVYVCKEPQTHKPGMATRFLRSFDGPFQVIGHPYDQNDLLTLKNLSTGAVIPRPVNIEKCVVIPEQEPFDPQPSNDSVVESEPEAESPAPLPTASHVNPELCQVAYEFGKYLASLPNKTATASQACKQVYLSYPSAREILTRHGKLRGLIKACPYLQMDGEAHGGLYLLSLNQEAFRKLFPSF